MAATVDRRLAIVLVLAASAVCAFFRYDTGAGDLFNSYDHNPGGNPHETADYCVVYSDWYPYYPSKEKAKKIKIIPGRRWKSWYQGTQDYRCVFICRELIAELREAGKDVATFETVLQQGHRERG